VGNGFHRRVYTIICEKSEENVRQNSALPGREMVINVLDPRFILSFEVPSNETMHIIPDSATLKYELFKDFSISLFHSAKVLQ
jgi:hypothetical protein